MAKNVRKKSATEEPVAASKTRIILAAEALFASGGIEATSLREIAVKAGQGNHFAVQYHFGSRDGLVRAVFDYRMQQMEPTRGRMLAEAEARGSLKDARTLLEIVYLPQLEIRDEQGKHSYANFLFQYLQRFRSASFGDFGSELPPNLARTLDLLRHRIDYLPTPVAQRRLVTASLMFLNILATHDPSSHNVAGESLEAAVDDTLEQIVMAICLPLRPRQSPRPIVEERT